MINRDIHLLCTGDLHLGRHPARIPEEYDSYNYSPVYVWEKIIDKAVDLDVDCLLITGDIVDRDNRFYEAFGPFEAGIERLKNNNIDVFAVAGNHDFDVLPRMAKNIDQDNFNLLGEGGNWELKTLQKDGKKLINIIGWSYPYRRVSRNPLTDLEISNSDQPTIALLHCETNNPASNYAPVSVDNLQSQGITGWVLGHIHKPQLISASPAFILYPGSPQPLHPSEPGNHGIWEIIIKSDKNTEIKKYPLASLKYISLEIDVSNLKQIERLPALISKKIKKECYYDQDIVQTPDLIIARIDLTGRSNLSQIIAAKQESLLKIQLKLSNSRVIIEKINNQTRPAVDIKELADGKSQVALLAEYLIKLESGRGEQLPDSLLEKVEYKLLEAYNSNAYMPLRRQNCIQLPGRKEVFSVLKKEARVLLNTLLDQKEEL